MVVINGLEVLLNLGVVVSDHLSELLFSLLHLFTVNKDFEHPCSRLNPEFKGLGSLTSQVISSLVKLFLRNEQLEVQFGEV